MSYQENLKAARLSKGLTLEGATFAVRGILPKSQWVTLSTVRRTEMGGTRRPNVTLIAALCEVYGVQFSQVAPELLADANSMSTLLAATASYAARDSNPEPTDIGARAA